MQYKALTGNTYPIRDKLKSMGGKWNSSRKLWEVPEHKWEEASKLLKDAPDPVMSQTDRIAISVRKRGGTPGVCSGCGAKCKYPYDECWDCKEERDMGY